MQLHKSVFLRFLRDQSGATAVEYGLLVAMIALACVTAYTTLGESLVRMMGSDEGGLADELNKADARLN